MVLESKKADTLNISESFYSVQCEGVSTGYPAYFIRLRGCNLMSIGVKPGRRIPRVWTPSGKKKITDIKPDDNVLALDESTGKLAETKVKAVFNYDIEDHIEIKVEGKPILYTSLEHPFLTNNGWKRADELTDGDEIMHFDWRDMNSFNKMSGKNPMKRSEVSQKSAQNTDYATVGEKVSSTRKQLFKEGKLKTVVENQKESGTYDDNMRKLSKRMKEDNLMFDPDVVKKSTAAHNLTRYNDTVYMSKTEADFHKLCIEADIPVDYVGRFDLPVPVEGTNKHIYPDFILRGTNRVIETYWSHGKHVNRDNKWVKNRRQILEAAGYDPVFVDFTALNTSDIKDLIQSELTVKNGCKVVYTKVIKHKRQCPSQTCNKLNCYDLTCFPHHTFIVEGMVTHNCGGKDGSLVKEGKATWWCDSEAIWRQGIKTDFDTLIDKWEVEGIRQWILDGRIHLIWTGGEPTLKKHQSDIVSFLNHLEDRYDCDKDHQLYSFPVYNEVETNGTQYIEDDLFDKLDQINCSVKLANSGMSEAKRIVPDALKRIIQHGNHYFKFVISDEEDIAEIERDFVKPFNMHPSTVLLMPGLSTRDNFHERTAFCLEMAKKYGYIGLTRLHISAWNETTGC